MFNFKSILLIAALSVLYQFLLAQPPDIIKIEYFIDTDPGIGLGVDVPLVAAPSQDLMVNVPTGTLSEGFHLLTVRAQDQNNEWGIVENKAFFVGQSSTLSSNNITKIEYFIDADPGQGLGVDVSITSASSLNVLENVPTGSLNEGFHVLTIRGQDENGIWSMSENKAFYVSQSSTISINNITKIEYFIDSDPGHGLGTDIPITSAANQNLLENIPTGTLNEGFHVLTVRAQDENGIWSQVENKIFYINQSTTITINNITKIEYFIGPDPGHGAGIDVPVTSAPNFDFLENVPTGSLNEGFHVLTVRAQDENGIWSHAENSLFFVSQSSTLTQNNITKIEYYIDSDPGHGLGVDIPITAATNFNILENVPTSSLSEGFHTISVRALDQDLKWSLLESKPFYVSQSSTLSQNQITKLEYFIDADPGHGSGVDIPITAAISLDVLENIPTATMPEGFHVLTLRAQDQNGEWSLTESKPFYISQSSTLAQNQITKLEYFIDADPGLGAGTDIPITSTTDLNVLENIPTGTLTEGFQILTLRAQDQNGKWSMTEQKPFYVDRRRQIVAYEYAVDTDPGIGTANLQTIAPPQDSIDVLLTVPTTSLALGGHNLLVRALDENNFWSKTNIIPFNLCDGALTSFTATNVCEGASTDFIDSSTSQAGDIYSWDFDGDGLEDDNTFGNAAFTYPTAGTYTATLLVDRSGCKDSTAVVVNVENSPNPNAGADQVICTDNTSLSAVAPNTGETGTWSIITGAGSFANINDPNTTFSSVTSQNNQLRWTVENDLLGCSEFDDVIIQSNQPLAAAGVDQDICLDNTTLAATPANTGETGTWSIISGSGSFSDVNDPNTTFSSITSQNNQLRWTVENDLLGCSQFDDVIIQSNQPLAAAGVDQDICIDNTTLAATPANTGETGTWSIISGSGSFSDVNDPNATFSNITSFNNQVRWTVTNNTLGCSDSDDIFITSNQPISTSPLTNTVALGEVVVFDVQASAMINPGDNLTTSIQTPPTKGVAVVVTNGSIEYVPDNGTVGMDTVQFRLCNQCNNCTDSYIAADIQNNPPEISTGTNTLDASDSLVISLLDIISDLNNNLDLSSLRIVQQPISGASASIDVNYNLIIDYTGVIFVGTDEIILEVCDLLGACANSSVFIEVNLPGESSSSPPVTVFNAISPNTADGKHDYLELENIDAYPNNSLFIFNRWGRKVYEVVGYDNDVIKFDGTGNTGGAQDLPGGTYFYKLDLGNGTVMSGFLVLKK